MNYDEWKTFYDYETGDVRDSWSNMIASYLPRLGINCTIVFRYHHSRLIDSRKKNCTLFSADGYCKAELCPVTADIEIATEPKMKGEPTVFKLLLTGEKNHDPKQQTVSRSITGDIREAIGMF